MCVCVSHDSLLYYYIYLFVCLCVYIPQVKDARVEKCGQLGVLGKYCLHFHQTRSCPTCEFTNNAIVDSTQRGIIVHGAHDTTVRGNVFWKVRGSNLYVEDGNEMHNTFQDNVAICHDEVFEAPECKAAGTDNDFADNIQQTGFWALSVSNDFIGNRMAGHYNALFTQTTAFPMGRGAAQQKVCTHQSSFRKMEGNVQHSNWKFGFYLDSNEPRHTNRDVASNGWVRDIDNMYNPNAWCSCDEFTPLGEDNGAVAIAADTTDYFNLFVGQYDVLDVQYLRHNSVNNGEFLSSRVLSVLFCFVQFSSVLFCLVFVSFYLILPHIYSAWHVLEADQELSER